MPKPEAVLNISLMNRAFRWSWLLGRRVFIVWKNPLFYESVRLLLRHPEIDIIGETANFADAQDIIGRLRPDTVIVEELGNEVPAEVLAVLERSKWHTRIIGFSLDDNRLNLYHREERTAAEAADLLHLVNSD